MIRWMVAGSSKTVCGDGLLCDVWPLVQKYPYDTTLCQYTADNAPFDNQEFTPFATVMQRRDVFVSGTMMSSPSLVPEQLTYESQGTPWMLQHYPTIQISFKE
mmetsp:Transcript_14227/g.15969  ORF Transcript_14227/g.15969 Transcript_14227/m.15969 type:complete len:103 (+) Transcript_14227:256-564(+)